MASYDAREMALVTRRRHTIIDVLNNIGEKLHGTLTRRDVAASRETMTLAHTSPDRRLPKVRLSSQTHRNKYK